MKNKILNVVCITIISILLFATNVFAANDSFKTSLSTSSSTVKRGEDVTITISLKDILIESGEKGIGAYSANIEFDSSVLEFSKSTGTDNWEAPFYSDNIIVGNTSNGQVVKTNQNIGSITFKVKENATLGETTIKLTNFSGSSVANDIDAEDTSIKITVIDKDAGEGGNNQNGNGTSDNGSQNGEGSNNNDQTQNGNGSNNGETQSGNGEGNTGIQNGNGSVNGSNGSSNGTSNKSNNINDATKDGVIPQTGDINITLYILISIFTLVSIILFIKIKLINKRIKNNI